MRPQSTPASMVLTRIRLALHARSGLRRGWDFLAASALRRLSAGQRRRLFGGDRFFCPVCETSLRTFLKLHRPYNLWCPVCWSLQRHRFIWLFFREKVAPALHVDRGWRMLHIAPEPSLVDRFKALPGIDYLSADLYDPQAMVRMDIGAIQYPAGTFDLIYCSHVLEHVPDDHRALAEFARVLAPDGKAIILVPILREQTLEDPSITDPAQRERIFGQHDHVRVYGWDVVDRFNDAGFEVEIVRRADVTPDAEVQRLGLTHNEIVFVLDKKRTLR